MLLCIQIHSRTHITVQLYTKCVIQVCVFLLCTRLWFLCKGRLGSDLHDSRQSLAILRREHTKSMIAEDATYKRIPFYRYPSSVGYHLHSNFELHIQIYRWLERDIVPKSVEFETNVIQRLSVHMCETSIKVTGELK